MTPTGTVVAAQLCPGHRLPMAARAEVRAVAGLGLEGDFHARGGRRQVLLIDLEILEALGLKPGQVKENLTVRGNRPPGPAGRNPPAGGFRGRPGAHRTLHPLRPDG